MVIIKSIQDLKVAIKISWLVACLILLTGCAMDMYDQPRYEPLEKSSLAGNALSARPHIANTVDRSQPELDQHLASGQLNGELAPTFPFTVTLEVLQRGQERYNIFCGPCHGALGDGQGIVVEYGLEAPPSFHTPEMRDERPGFYFDVISRGTRVMPSYASRIPPADRWAIIAYIRALQLSQNSDLSNVPAQEVPNLDNTEVITR
ncbi:MAG: c-type cytochrome [Anaerolineae bacterium]|nr:c-type cytochrome [Anaerolineae bacterium]